MGKNVINEVNKDVAIEIKKLSSFTLNADKILKVKLDAINEESLELINQYQELELQMNVDANIKTSKKIIGTRIKSEKHLSKIFNVTSDIYAILMNNKGFESSVNNIKYIQFMLKKNGYKKHAMITQNRLMQVAYEIVEFFRDYIMSYLKEHTLMLNYYIELELENLIDNVETETKIDPEAEEINGPQKLFSRRDMEIFMKQNGYSIVRYNGDHAIYSNSERIIPVPARTIGKGLSIAIQKQVLASVA